MSPLPIRPHRCSHRLVPTGFTIIELLVVIAIIGVLVGLILPAIGSVQRRSHKTQEVNQLKQLGHAWMMYGNNNNDAALPGFLEPDVQSPPTPAMGGWGVTYHFPDKKDIPIDAQNLAGPWTWRLLSYVDFAHDLIHGYADEDEFSMVGVSGNPTEAKEIADQPAFGYNGFYIGGYWAMENVNGKMMPRYRFNNSTSLPDTQNNTGHPGGQPVSVCTTISKVQRSSDVLVFCTSTHYDTVGAQRHLTNDRPGSDLITPPWLGDEHRWDQLGWNQSPNSDPKYVETLMVPPSVHEGSPFGRFTGDPAILYADGHVDTQTVGSLLDMRKWIDSASYFSYKHTP